MNRTTDTWKLLKIGLVANIIEWYEFSIYGYLSAVIGRLFFKETTATLALIQAFSIFAIRYLARPFGSLFFGMLADRKGRRYSLRLSLLMMSIPTILIGLLPVYQTIGYWAPGLLLLLSFIQGFAAGGEFPVNGCYIFEHAPPQYKSLLCCAVGMGNYTGFLCGAGVSALLLSYVDPETIHAWAWRIPFLLGIPLTFLVITIRKTLIESNPLVLTQKKHPFSIILTTERKSLLMGIGLAALPAAIGTQALSLWMPFYLIHFLHYPESMVYSINTLMMFLGIPFSFLAAWLTRFMRLKTIICLSTGLLLLIAYPLIAQLQSVSSITLILSLLTLKLLCSGTGGIILEVLASLFTQARSTGMSVAFSIAAGVFGGLTPLILTYITDRFGVISLAYYCIAFSLLAFISATQLPTKVHHHES